MDTGIEQRLQRVQAKLALCMSKAPRQQAVKLVAVSKLHSARAIVQATALGQLAFGENYVQEALQKQQELTALPLEWHFIGHLQSNKAKDVAGKFALIHSVDSLSLAKALSKRMESGKQKILIQVNVGQEEQKGGISEAELPALLEVILELPHLDVQGLMCLPPFFDEPELSRPYFIRLRQLRDALVQSVGHPLPELSMGMSMDFAVAIEEGATIVRVGTEIFGERPKQVTL